MLYAVLLPMLFGSRVFGAAEVFGVADSMFDQGISLVTNVGLPIAIIVMIYRDFVRPLGGEHGIIARYFDSQTEHSAKQTELIGEQKSLTKQLSGSVLGIASSQSQHIEETRTFINRATVDLNDLVRIHGLIATAMRKEFSSSDAKGDLEEVDRIVDKYLRRDAHIE